MNHYSRWICALAGAGCAWLAAGSAPAAEVEVGTSREDVIDQIGEPDGMAVMGETEILYYPRGQVDLEDGTVVRSGVLSEAEYEAEQQRLAEEAEARREAAAAAAERRRAEGLEKLESIRTEKTMAGKPAAERLAFWKRFQRQYPTVDVSTELAEAQSDVRTRQEAAEALEEKVQERLETSAPEGLSRSKLRRYRRGRSESALAEQEAEIREQLREEMDLPGGR